jgi:hypothetical protein
MSNLTVGTVNTVCARGRLFPTSIFLPDNPEDVSRRKLRKFCRQNLAALAFLSWLYQGVVPRDLKFRALSSLDSYRVSRGRTALTHTLAGMTACILLSQASLLVHVLVTGRSWFLGLIAVPFIGWSVYMLRCCLEEASRKKALAQKYLEEYKDNMNNWF